MHPDASAALEAELARPDGHPDRAFTDRRLASLRALHAAGFRLTGCGPGRLAGISAALWDVVEREAGGEGSGSEPAP